MAQHQAGARPLCAGQWSTQAGQSEGGREPEGLVRGRVRHGGLESEDAVVRPRQSRAGTRGLS